MATQNNMDLTQGKPFSVLLKFAIPVILGNLFQLFYTLADSVIVGKTMGAEALAAVGSTSSASSTDSPAASESASVSVSVPAIRRA